MKPKLQAVKYDGNRFCGPAAVSILTGVTTGRAAELIRQHSGTRAVKGTYAWEVLAALHACGLKTGWRVRRTQIKDYKGVNGTYLIAYDNHWAVVTGTKYCCGVVNHGKPVAIDSAVCPRNARVTDSYLISPGTGKPPRKIKTHKSVNPGKKKTLALAYTVGCDIDVLSSETVGVFPPEGFAGDDPYDDAHYHDTWEDAYQAVLAYSNLKGV